MPLPAYDEVVCWVDVYLGLCSVLLLLLAAVEAAASVNLLVASFGLYILGPAGGAVVEASADVMLLSTVVEGEVLVSIGLLPESYFRGTYSLFIDCASTFTGDACDCERDSVSEVDWR